MISTIGRIPPSAAPMPAPTKADSESGGVADALGSKFFQQTLGYGITTAVAANVFAHNEDPRIAD
jgi:hypothetical protein